MVYINTKLWQSALAEKSSRKKTRDAYINAPADCCNAELEPDIISCNTSPEQRFFVLLSLSNVVNRRFFYAILQTNIERCRKAVLCQLMCLGVWDEKYLEGPSLVLEICLL